MNSSAALSLTKDPIAGEYKNVELTPRMLYALQHNGKRKRGRVSTKPVTNVRKVHDRVEGLDGYIRRTHVLNRHEVNTYRQQLRRAKKKGITVPINKSAIEY